MIHREFDIFPRIIGDIRVNGSILWQLFLRLIKKGTADEWAMGEGGSYDDTEYS